MRCLSQATAHAAVAAVAPDLQHIGFSPAEHRFLPSGEFPGSFCPLPRDEWRKALNNEAFPHLAYSGLDSTSALSPAEFGFSPHLRTQCSRSRWPVEFPKLPARDV